MPSTVEHQTNRFGIETMLFDQDARRERRDGVAVENGHGRLQDDRTAIEFGRDQVHGRAAHANTMVERLTLRVETRE